MTRICETGGRYLHWIGYRQLEISKQIFNNKNKSPKDLIASNNGLRQIMAYERQLSKKDFLDL